MTIDVRIIEVMVVLVIFTGIIAYKFGRRVEAEMWESKVDKFGGAK